MKIKLSSFLQLKPNVFLYRHLGWRMAFFYMQFLGCLYFTLNRKEKRTIAGSIKELYGKSRNQEEVKVITGRVFRGIMAHYYEKIFNAYVQIDVLKSFFERNIETGSLGKIDQALKSGKGVLFVTGHYGGIEYIPIFLALNNYPISVVAKFATPQLKQTLQEKTKGLGLRIIDAREQRSLVGSIIRELRANRILFFECDEIEEWKPSQGERMVFLKKMVGIDRTISVLKKRTDSEIIFGILHRYSIERYRLIIRNWQDLISGVKEIPISIGEVLLKHLENYIYSYPEEWYQWKNFAAIGSSSVSQRKVSRPVQAFPKPALS
ncbi:MAG: hypothetical protein JRH06_09050 [Deltaproteobacteria bacterium]|nr:hypothetical protein [Deltaproteobacteria bacterium]